MSKKAEMDAETIVKMLIAFGVLIILIAGLIAIKSGMLSGIANFFSFLGFGG